MSAGREPVYGQRRGEPLPAELEALLLACLAKRSEERPQSARDLSRQLAACAAATPWSEDDALDARAFWVHWRGASSGRSARCSRLTRLVIFG